MADKTLRCTDCRSEFTDEEVLKSAKCPSCGSVSAPCSIDQDVTIRINWHELRILTIWAHWWALKNFPDGPAMKTLTKIIQELEKQAPEGSGWSPLTFEAELQQVADALRTDVKMVVDGELEVTKKPETVN